MKHYILFLCTFFSMVSGRVYSDLDYTFQGTKGAGGMRNDFASHIHNYMWANYLQFNGDVQQANNWYKTILSSNNSEHTLKGYLYFLYETGNYKLIVQLMQMKNVCAHDVDIQLIFARSLRQEGNKKQADELMITLSNTFKNNVDVVFEATQIYIERKELENALQVMNEILNNSPKKPNFFVFYFLKAQIYAQLHDYKNAHNYINLCIESNPRFDKCWLLQGIVCEQEGNIKSAIKGYSTYLETTDSADKKVQQHLLELLLRVNTEHNKQVFRHIFTPGGLFYYDMRYADILHTMDHNGYTCFYLYNHMLYQKQSMQLSNNGWSVLSL